MDFFEVVEKRHSVRRFTGETIPQEHIAKILGAALTAPSSKNARSTGFIVVEQGEILEKMSVMRDSGSSFLKYAPMAVVVTGDGDATDLWAENAAISATFIQLAAVALGLATCWVQVNGRSRLNGDPSAGTAEDYLKTFLPATDGKHVLCVIAVGYADPEVKTVPRPDPDSVHIAAL